MSSYLDRQRSAPSSRNLEDEYGRRRVATGHAVPGRPARPPGTPPSYLDDDYVMEGHMGNRPRREWATPEPERPVMPQPARPPGTPPSYLDDDYVMEGHMGNRPRREWGTPEPEQQ
jgi:hypothetical protein